MQVGVPDELSQYSVKPQLTAPQAGAGTHCLVTSSTKPGRQAPQAATCPVCPQVRRCMAQVSPMPASPGAQVGSLAHPGETHARQVWVAESHLYSASQLSATQLLSWPAVSLQVWCALQLPLRTRAAQVTGARHRASQTKPPAHTLPAPHGQPTTSAEQVRQTLDVSQYLLPSHFGSELLQGHPSAPAWQEEGTHVPELQTSEF